MMYFHWVDKPFKFIVKRFMRSGWWIKTNRGWLIVHKNDVIYGPQVPYTYDCSYEVVLQGFTPSGVMTTNQFQSTGINCFNGDFHSWQ